MAVRHETEVPAQKATGSARVYAQLRQDILRVGIAPGSPLDEVSLSERFGLSRSPIREALARLSSDGLVQILPNRSTIVTPIDVQGLPEFIDALDLLQRVTTRSAAMYRTEEDLKAIVAAQIDYEEGARLSLETGDSLPMIETNYAFHMAIARAGRNSYFLDYYRRLLDQGRRMLHFHFEFQQLDPEMSVEKLASGHTDMVAAIKNRQVDKAEQVAHAHAVQFKGRFMKFLGRNASADMRLGRDRDL
jgi:DNA-binding GntR family transcriptional regulator